MTTVYETEHPTEIDMQYDSYVRSSFYRTKMKILEFWKPITKNEISLDDLIEQSGFDKGIEDEYNIDTPHIHIESGNKTNYRIDDPDLYDALKMLTSIERETLLMNVFNGCTDREIEKVLGISRSTIHTKRRRVIGKVRTFLLRRRMDK